jgi:predicted RNase H-like HicB family nuclease
MRLNHTIMAAIHPGDQSGYVAECLQVPIITQGETLDETIKNLREATELYFEGEDPAELGFVPNPTLVVTMELETACPA